MFNFKSSQIITKNILGQPSFAISILLLLIYLSPYIILREEATTCIIDGLEYLWTFKMLAESNMLFANSQEIIPNMMNGLSRLSYPSELNFIHIYYYLFSAPVAYMINSIVVHVISFFALRLFLIERKEIYTIFNRTGIIFDDKYKEFFINFSALFYALIPHWSYGGISTAGIPLIVNCFLNFIENKYRKRDILILILYPFYSSFILSNLFLVIGLFIYFLFYTYRTKKLNYKYLVFLILFIGLSVITEYRTFVAIIDGYESQRNSGISKISNTNFHVFSFIGSIYQRIVNNVDGYLYSYHDAPHRAFPYNLLIIIFALFHSFIYSHKRTFRILLLLILFSLFNGFNRSLKGEIMQVVNLLNIPFISKNLGGMTFRMYILNPFIIIVCFFISLIYLSTISEKVKHIMMGYLLWCNFYVFVSMGKVVNIQQVRPTETIFANNIKKKSNDLTFKSYIDTKLFREIDDYIKTNFKMNKKEYRISVIVDHVYFPPVFTSSPFLYNGFYTIDGYNVFYSKKYADTFYQIIDKELEKANMKREYGHRLYLFSYDTTYDGKIKKLDFNYDILRQLNCKFIFSRREVLNLDSNLVFIRRFDGIYWKINMYYVRGLNDKLNL